MYKKISMILMIVLMVTALGSFAQAARIPGPGDQFVVKAGTEFPAIVPVQGRLHRFLVKAFEDVTVTVTAIENGLVIFTYKNFPHDCYVHGRELVDLAKAGIPFEYFENNPDAFSPSN